MSTRLEPGRLDWTRANWTVDGRTQQVHFWGDGQHFTVADTQGNELAYLSLAADGEGLFTVERLDAKTFALTGDDGTEWIVSKRGCNCGGG